MLASKSASRRLLLEGAGVPVDVEAPAVDERAVEQAFLGEGGAADQLAARLARAKAIEVSARRPGALCIGADQTLLLDGDLLHKPKDMAGAEESLCRLSGRTHVLNSALCVARDGAPLMEASQSARLTMRALDRQMVRRYLAAAGPGILSSVGAYQVEGLGIHLFEAIDGDHWTILGLPLLSLLRWLRANRLLAL